MREMQSGHELHLGAIFDWFSLSTSFWFCFYSSFCFWNKVSLLKLVELKPNQQQQQLKLVTFAFPGTAKWLDRKAWAKANSRARFCFEKRGSRAFMILLVSSFEGSVTEKKHHETHSEAKFSSAGSRVILSRSLTAPLSLQLDNRLVEDLNLNLMLIRD